MATYGDTVTPFKKGMVTLDAGHVLSSLQLSDSIGVALATASLTAPSFVVSKDIQ